MRERHCCDGLCTHGLDCPATRHQVGARLARGAAARRALAAARVLAWGTGLASLLGLCVAANVLWAGAPL